MPSTTGYFRPGQAGGSADPYASPTVRTPRGGGGGFLDKLMKMKLDLAKEQLLQMQQQREQTRRAMQAPTRVPAPVKGFTKGERQVSGPSPREWQLASDPTYMHAPGAAEAIQRVNEWMGPQTVAQMMMQKGKNWTDAMGAASRAAPGAGAATLAGILGGRREAGGGAVERGGSPMRSNIAPVDPSMFLPPGGLGGLQTKPIPSGTMLETYGAPGSVGPEGPQLPRRGVQARGAGGSVLSQYKEGTLPGTVPETGKTTVHKGEVVIPEAQVTPSLMAMLIEDASKKGTLKKGYKCGTLKPGYQRGTLAEEQDETMRELNLLLEGGEPERRPSAAEGFGKSLGYGLGQMTDLLGQGLTAGREAMQSVKAGFTGRPLEDIEMERRRGITERLTAAEAPEDMRTMLEKAKAEAPPPEEPKAKVPQETGGDERERLYNQLRGMPEQVQAQHKAKMSEIEAERLLDILRFNRNIDPQVAKSILDKVAFNMKVSGKYSTMARDREKAVEQELKAGAGLDRQIAYWREREAATGERMINVKEMEQLFRTEAKSQEQRNKLMMEMHKVSVTDKLGSNRQRALQKIGQLLVQTSLETDLPDLTLEEAMEMAQVFIGFDADQAESFLRQITGSR